MTERTRVRKEERKSEVALAGLMNTCVLGGYKVRNENLLRKSFENGLRLSSSF